MKRLLLAACLAAALFAVPHIAQAGSGGYDALVKVHARANSVPEALVHRVILRESRYQPDLVGRGGTIGLMQIKLGTARALGYTGDATGLHDPETNLKYGVKYLAGAYRAAHADHARAVHLYTVGYYDVAKRQRLEFAASPWLAFRMRSPPHAPKGGVGKEIWDLCRRRQPFMCATVAYLRAILEAARLRVAIEGFREGFREAPICSIPRSASPAARLGPAQAPDEARSGPGSRSIAGISHAMTSLGALTPAAIGLH